MLLRNPVSTTKRFLHRTLHSFLKYSLFHYHRVPKAPPHDPPTSTSTMDHHHPTFENRKIVEFNVLCFDCNSRLEQNRCLLAEKNHGKMKSHRARRPNSKALLLPNKEKEKEKGRRSMEERRMWVARRLKELEMMDASNVDLVLDVEEAVHYYSRINCPEFVDIVDKFFARVCCEFFERGTVDSKSTTCSLQHC